jgi:RNA polymerase sigma-70 factor, ECF subfamily
MRDLTFTDVERLDAAEASETFQMDEETFRGFYDRTARSVWAYLSRLTGDRQLADDLLQETYYRFLRTDRAFASDAHRRNYLFRIATNLVRDAAQARD